MSNLAALERLLCERYNVRELDGPLKDAIDANDEVTLRALLSERDLYRWHGPIMAALSGEPEPAVAEVAVEVSEPEPPVDEAEPVSEYDQPGEQPDDEADETPAPRRRGKSN